MKKNDPYSLEAQKHLQYFICGGMVFVGWFLPEDILTKHEWARNYTEWMGSIFPSIHWVKNLGVHTEINAFYQALLWPFCLVMAAWIVINQYQAHSNQYGKMGKVPVTSGDFFRSVWFVFIMGYFFYFVYSFEQGDSIPRPMGFFFINRFGRGFMLLLLVLTCCIYVYYHLLYLVYFCQGRLAWVEKEEEKEKGEMK